MQDPDAAGGFVAFETGSEDPVLKAPGEAQALAMNLLSAASDARAQRQCDEAEEERNAALGALAAVASRLPDFKVGVDDEVGPANSVDVEEYRRLWIRGVEVVGAWLVPDEDVPEWVECRECPGEPDEDALAVLVEKVTAGSEPERVHA